MYKNNWFAFKGNISTIKVVKAGHSTIQNEENTAENEASTANKLDLFDENFNLKLRVYAGDVYLARIPKRLGSELEGDHFVVAVMNSNAKNPNVVVVPLTSLKEKARNPAHSLYLGLIRGIENGKESVALLNQVVCLDKKRFLSDGNIELALKELENKTFNVNDVVCEIYETHYRLTNEQCEKMTKEASKYFGRNSRKRKERKLVDF